MHPHDKPWWEQPAAMAVSMLREIQQRYHKDHGWRRSRAKRLGSLYHGQDLDAPGANESRLTWDSGISEGEVPITRNKAFEYTETCVSGVGAADAPKPVIMLTEAPWEMKKQAILNGRMLEAEYDLPQGGGKYANLHALTLQGLRIAYSATGSVATKVYAWPKEDRVVVELHDTLDMFLDESETLYGHPRTTGEVTFWPRYRLCENFPDHKAQILEAPTTNIDQAALTLTGRQSKLDLVPVWEAWAVKGSDGSDGRYICFLEDGTVLDDKPWEDTETPFCFFHASPQLTGFWGIPLLEFVYGEVIAVNEIIHELDRAHCTMPKAVHYVHEGSLVDIGDIEEVDTVQVVRLKDREYKPTVENPPAYPSTSIELLRNHEEAIARTLGVSEMRSSGAHQPGLPSAIAQREARASFDGRQAWLHRAYTQWVAVSNGRAILKAQRRLYEDNPGFKRTWQGEFFAREVKAEDVLDLDEAALHAAIKPVSEKKNTPEERLQFAQELLDQHAIPIESYIEMVRLYDVPGETRVIKTQRRWLAWQIEKWLMLEEEEFIAQSEEEDPEQASTEEFYQGPRPWMRKADALVQVVDALMEAEIDGVPQERLQYFQDFIAELTSMMQSEMPQPKQTQAIAPPVGGGPMGVDPAAGGAMPAAPELAMIPGGP